MSSSNQQNNDKSSGHDAYFSRRVLITAGIILVMAGALYIIGHLSQLVLVILAGVLLGVLLDGLALRLSERFPLSRGVALAMIVVFIAAVLGGAGWFAGPRLADQVGQLTNRIPEAVEQIKLTLMERDWGKLIVENMPAPKEILPFGSQELISAEKAFSSVFSATVDVLIILFIGLYLAAAPGLYINNALRLLPKDRRGRMKEVIETVTRVLQRWLVGRLASMLVVGLLTGLGLWLIGVPLAVTLGLIAALMSFVPFIGPLLSTIPAALVALAKDPLLVVYVLIVFAIVQTLESYVITPLIQRRAVSLPPALLISIQILMGALFGTLGLFLATPTAVAVIVMVQMLYVEDILGDRTKILGTH